MKVRIKFSKTGPLKFVGHLDTMRYFQKLMRRACIPISYSEGFSPHQIMSFAMPLGTGVESIAEYVDIEISEHISSKEAIERMNEKSVPEIRILSFREIPDGKKTNAMSSITAAGYTIHFRDELKPGFPLKETFTKFIASDSINIVKQSKKSESVVDLKPFIYDYEVSDDEIRLIVSCGSVMNIKPELVMKALYEYAASEFDEYALLITRNEMYTGEFKGNIEELKSLNDVGTDIE